MKYSVIIPYWNAENWLGRCCESIQRQDGDFEVLLVNDGSTDCGKAIAEDYAEADSRFTALDNERAKGVSGARNTGIDWAVGDWITFLDADDELLENAFKIFDLAVKKDADICQMNHLRYYTAIEKQTLKYANKPGWYDITNLPQHWFAVWNKLYRKEFLEDVRFDEGLQYGEDGLFVLACLAKGGRIWHMAKDLTTVRHRFDNPFSLSKSKSGPDLLHQVHTYEQFMLDQTDPVVRLTVCQEISRLWSSVAFEKAFGV